MRGAVVGEGKEGGGGTKHWTLEPVPSFHLIVASARHGQGNMKGNKMKGFECLKGLKWFYQQF